MRVLISAYACEPEKGSEGGVGWNWSVQIAKYHQVTVITRENNKIPIEEYLSKNSLVNINFIYYDIPNFLKFFKKGNKGIYLYYLLWQIGIYFRLKSEIVIYKFDIIHHLTFGTFWLPSFLILLKIPFIWGPVGGGELLPKGFFRFLSLRGKINEVARLVLHILSSLNPLIYVLARKSKVILAATKETKLILTRYGAKNVIVEPQLGTSELELIRLSSYKSNSDEKFRFISIGRLIPWKGFQLGIYAFSSIAKNNKDAEYLIISDGPEKKQLMKIVQKLGLEKQIIFLGRLPTLNDVYSYLGKADILVHPAMHEAFGNVVLEALSIGKPVICLDIGGPALQVNSQNGFKIPVSDPDKVIPLLSSAMLKCIIDRKYVDQLSFEAIKQVKNKFSWDNKIPLINKIYAEQS